MTTARISRDVRRTGWATDERGQVSVWAALIALPLLLLAAVLVFDGGQVLAAKRRAMNSAEAAARAGALAPSKESMRGDGATVLDPVRARARAGAHLAQLGYRGTVSVTGNAVVVEVAVDQPLVAGGLVGASRATVTGTGSAEAERGLVEAVNEGDGDV